ncbi:hypothetical protein [Stappia sp.]|uniref:hypothetical protein n=1 Tax=Stappia sp. TaxID=1870903 RepID=UPI003C7C7CAF
MDKRKWVTVFIALVALVPFALLLIDFFVLMRFISGSRFVVNNIYFDATWDFALLLIIYSFFGFCICLLSDVDKKTGSGHFDYILDKFESPFIFVRFLCAAWFGYIVATFFVGMAIPYLYSLSFGYPVAHIHTIKSEGYSNQRGCPSGMVLAGESFGSMHSLCDLAPAFRSQLKPGMKIRLSGPGTWMGVFYEKIEILE